MWTCLQLFPTPILPDCILWYSAGRPFDRYLILPAANTAPIDCDIMLVKCLDASGSWWACRCLHVCVCTDFHVFMFATLISCRVVTVDYLELRLDVIYQFPTWVEMEFILQYFWWLSESSSLTTAVTDKRKKAGASGCTTPLECRFTFLNNYSRRPPCARDSWGHL